MRAAVRAGVCVLAMAATSPAVAAAPAGASSCTGCHGGGGVVAALDGRPAAELVAAMAAFRAGGRTATVMGRIAKGFSDAEARAIADWFAAQPGRARRAQP
ncbi:MULTISPECIES: c-type cytochrome [unclassified Phenylobacterium]|uniref:c-type cytochrome n=1 Tax=unclassified Phenylobacterium TaxID=2640670 RepID=UPI00083B5512|nr:MULTISPECIES: c-type cytochrome [unclassified Phenylobacterium]